MVNATPRQLYPPRKVPGTHCIRGWVGPQGRSGRVRKISPNPGIRSPDRPARSKTLYRLSYRGSPHIVSVSHGMAKPSKLHIKSWWGFVYGNIRITYHIGGGGGQNNKGMSQLLGFYTRPQTTISKTYITACQSGNPLSVHQPKSYFPLLHPPLLLRDLRLPLS
jgi:hypothetical protein